MTEGNRPNSQDLEVLGLRPERASEVMPPTHWSRFRRACRICYYRIGHWARQGPIWERTLHTVIYLALPIAAAAKIGWSWKTIGAICSLILLRGVKAFRDNSPKHMQPLAKGYLERKLMLFRLVRDVPRSASMNEHEVRRFQQEALHLIASYVRDHRRDIGAKQIFANLLVGDGDFMVVVARDQVHRVGGARYPKSVMVASQALDTGHTQLVGELYEEWPQTVAGKPYRSILAIPVTTDTKVVGVVSIDSSQPFHFHADPNLVNYLMPYVGLLAWTLDPGYARRISVTESTEGGLR